jgi:toxin ParE1/3/4
MPRSVRARAAEADALEISLYVAADNVAAADRLLARFDEALHRLAAQPHLGKSVEVIAPRLRLFPLGSNLIFYRPLDGGIELARLLHGARDITAEFFRD